MAQETRQRIRYKGFSIKVIYRKGIPQIVTFLGLSLETKIQSVKERIEEAKSVIDTFMNNDYNSFTVEEIDGLLQSYSHCKRMRTYIINQIKKKNENT